MGGFATCALGGIALACVHLVVPTEGRVPTARSRRRRHREALLLRLRHAPVGGAKRIPEGCGCSLRAKLEPNRHRMRYLFAPAPTCITNVARLRATVGRKRTEFGKAPPKTLPTQAELELFFVEFGPTPAESRAMAGRF